MSLFDVSLIELFCDVLDRRIQRETAKELEKDFSVLEVCMKALPFNFSQDNAMNL